MKKVSSTNKNKEELSLQYKDLKSKLFKLNFDLVANKLKDISQIKKTKKDIARLLTALNNLKRYE